MTTTHALFDLLKKEVPALDPAARVELFTKILTVTQQLHARELLACLSDDVVDAGIRAWFDMKTVMPERAILRDRMRSAVAATLLAVQPGGPKPAEFPALTPELADILGTVCFQCIPLVRALRAAGHQIKHRAEDEQAAALHWMLGHYFRAGDDGWRQSAGDDLKRMAEDAATGAPVGATA